MCARSGLWEVLQQVPSSLLQGTQCIAVDGTSGTAVMVDRNTHTPLTRPKLYNECQGLDIEETAKRITPDKHMASATSSTLCKLLAWEKQGVLQKVSLSPHSMKELVRVVAC